MPKINSLGTGYNSPVRQWGSQRRRYPLPRDTTHYLVEEEYIVNAANYAVQARDTANGTYASAYNVDQQIISERGDMVRFRRIYSTIPATRIEPDGTYNVRLPGLPTVNSPTAIATSSGSYANGVLTINTSAAHGLTTGDPVFVSAELTFSGWGGFATYVVNGQRICTVTDSDTLTVNIGNFPATATQVADIELSELPQLARSAHDKTVDTFIQYDYALPGVTSGISSIKDFSATSPIEFAYAIYDVDSTTVTYLPYLTATSKPTAAQYREWIANQTLLPIESSIRPYLGNILERATRYYIAQ